MTSIKIIEKTLFQILNQLAVDREIQKLLIDDTNDLSSEFTALNADEMFQQHYVAVAPLIDQGIKDVSRNTFIMGQIDSISFNSEDNSISASLYVVTDSEHMLLTDNHLRLLMLVDRIVQLTNYKKFSASGQIEVSYVSSIVYENYSYGYRIQLKFSNQDNGWKAEL